jgi:RNA polymerase sigma factor (sigma-70 family)
MLVQATTHASLLARLTERKDHTAWREFHDRYGELIRGFALSRGLQPSDCEDIMQDVLLSLTKAMPGFQYDPSKGKFRSYLKTATVRAVLKKNHQKHGEVNLQGIEQAARASAADATVDEAWEVEWREYHLRQAIRVIEAEFRQGDQRAFQRYAVEGRDARETAELLEMSVDQVYQAKSRIMRRLAELVERQVQDEG